jgi:hypothetical protein
VENKVGFQLEGGCMKKRKIVPFRHAAEPLILGILDTYDQPRYPSLT